MAWRWRSCCCSGPGRGCRKGPGCSECRLATSVALGLSTGYITDVGSVLSHKPEGEACLVERNVEEVVWVQVSGTVEDHVAR